MPKGFMNAIGFGSNGVSSGSAASGVQSYCYGGSVPKGSYFSQAQSYGAKGESSGKNDENPLS